MISQFEILLTYYDGKQTQTPPISVSQTLLLSLCQFLYYILTVLKHFITLMLIDI